MKKIIESNYDSIIKRGYITPSTNAFDFLDKLFEEVSELEEVINKIRDKQPSYEIFKDLNEELADVILVCLNFARHYRIDIEQELKNKIQKNYERARTNK